MSDRYKTIEGVEYKRCSSCKEYLPMTAEYFSKRSASKDGLAYSCKPCERRTAARSYDKKKQRQKARQRYEENKEVIKERTKKRYEENRDAILAQQKEWRKTQSGKKAMQKADKLRRERIKKQTPGGRDYTREEVIKRDSVFGDCVCQICGQIIDIEAGDLQIDHIIPIAEGGSDTLDNVRCTHKWCNLTRPKDGSDLEAIK